MHQRRDRDQTVAGIQNGHGTVQKGFCTDNQIFQSATAVKQVVKVVDLLLQAEFKVQPVIQKGKQF